MKLPDLQIRIGAIAKLQPVLPGIAIRDMEAGPADVLPYVLLSTQTTTDDSPKTEFQVQSTLLIQIIGKQALTVNRGEIDTIADTIMQTLIPKSRDGYLNVEGFTVCRVSLDSSNDDAMYEADGVSARKLIRLRISLYQN